jgi:hypothetical protein
MTFITGDDAIVAELARKIGVDPNKCSGIEIVIDIRPGKLLIARANMLMDEETVEFVTRRFKFVLDESDALQETA